MKRYNYKVVFRLTDINSDRWNKDIELYGCGHSDIMEKGEKYLDLYDYTYCLPLDWWIIDDKKGLIRELDKR